MGQQLQLTVGSKFEHNGYSGFEAQPEARLLWTPTPRQSAWAAISRAVRTPSRVEADLELEAFLLPSPLTFARLLGSKSFSSEKLLGYEAGYRDQIGPRLSVDLAGFFNDHRDLLSLETGAPFRESAPAFPRLIVPFTIANGLGGKTYGTEMSAKWQTLRQWRLQGSYSFVHLALRKSAGSTDTMTVTSTEGSSPNHQVVLESLINLPHQVEFDQIFRSVSALPAQHVASYGTVDLRLSWQPEQRVEFSLVGRNLAQDRHAEFSGDPGAVIEVKRSGYGKVTVRW
jgi:iron complex outermembrane receptor protein